MCTGVSKSGSPACNPITSGILSTMSISFLIGEVSIEFTRVESCLAVNVCTFFRFISGSNKSSLWSCCGLFEDVRKDVAKVVAFDCDVCVFFYVLVGWVESYGEGDFFEEGYECGVVADGCAFSGCEVEFLENVGQVFVFVVEGDVYFYFACEIAVSCHEGVGCIAVYACFFLNSVCDLG